LSESSTAKVNIGAVSFAVKHDVEALRDVKYKFKIFICFNKSCELSTAILRCGDIGVDVTNVDLLLERNTREI